jgi:hypothetical protein
MSTTTGSNVLEGNVTVGGKQIKLRIEATDVTPPPTVTPIITPIVTPVVTPVTVTPIAQKNTLVYNLTSSEQRTIVPISMQYPDGTWSDYVKYNFDTGASWATDVAPQFLTKFGYGSNGVGTDSSKRHEQPSKIRIQGLDGEFGLPVVVQDKDHYDLFRSQPPPTRYPLVRVRDITDDVTMVFTSKTTTLRLKSVPIPELSNPNRITLPDQAPRSGTPTSGWQWMKVKFTNPSDSSKSITDWFGLNTGDHKIIIKKESVASKIGLSLNSTDSCNYDSKCTMEFIEAFEPVKLTSAAVQVRKETCDFARGGDPRNIGGGLQFLSKYTLVLWDLHRAVIPV